MLVLKKTGGEIFFIFKYLFLIMVSNKSIPENKIAATGLPFNKVMVQVVNCFFFGNPDLECFPSEIGKVIGLNIPSLLQIQEFHCLFIVGIAPSDPKLNKFLVKRFLYKNAATWGYIPSLRFQLDHNLIF